MTLHWYDHVDAAVTIAGSAGLTGFLWKSGKRKAWPWLFSFSMLVLVATVACTGMQMKLATFHRMAGHPTLYAAWFYTYWAGRSIRALLGFGLLYETVHALPLSGSAPKNLRITFGAATLIVTGGCVYLASLTSPNTELLLSAFALSLQRAIAVSWCALSLTLILGTWCFALKWTPIPMRIMVGFLVSSLTYVLCAYFSAAEPLRAQALSTISDFTDAAVIAFWITALVTPEHARAVHDPEPLNHLLSPIGLRIPKQQTEGHTS